jgi:hypothetical protein
MSNLTWFNFIAAAYVNVKLKRSKPVNRVNPWFNETIERTMRERNICYAVWRARTDGDKTHLKLIRRRVTQNCKDIIYGQIPEPFTSRVMWKNFRHVN